MNIILPYIEDFITKFTYIDAKTKKVVNEKYDYKNKEQTRKMISKYQLQERSEKFSKWAMDNMATSLENMEHPGVNTRLYYINTFKTDGKYDFKFNPHDYNSHNKYVQDYYKDEEYTTYTGGDGTVPSFSAFVPFLKWTLNEKYSTEIVQICSNGNINKKNKKMKASYKGVECSCSKASEESCNHSSIITDKRFIREFQNNHLFNDVNEEIEERLKLSEKFILNQSYYICSNLKSWNDY